MGIEDGQWVEISNGNHSGRMKAKVTDLIHPEAVFMVHGFGHKLPIESLAFGKGVADNELMPGGLEIWDPAGGAVALQEHFVSVRKIVSVHGFRIFRHIHADTSICIRNQAFRSEVEKNFIDRCRDRIPHRPLFCTSRIECSSQGSGFDVAIRSENCTVSLSVGLASE